MAKDYYTTLGVSKTASAEEIKKAYRKLAHQHHPDKQGGDATKFKEINEAYQVLSDANKRSRYDQFGSAEGPGMGGGGGFDFSQGFGGFNGENIDLGDIFDIFSGAFGGGRSRAEESGNDIQVMLDISFFESARGAKKTIEIKGQFACDTCSGSGARKGSDLETCTVCKGSGQVREASRSLFGNIMRVHVCEHCHGVGKFAKEKCPDCRGSGKRTTTKTLEVTIPGGIRNGETLLVRGKGEYGGAGRSSGDLYITVRVAYDARFKREENNLVYVANIKLTDALLGASVDVPTLDGSEHIKIPSGVEEGSEIKLKGRGVWGSSKGDEIIRIHLVTPKKLSNKAKKLAEELSREL